MKTLLAAAAVLALAAPAAHAAEGINTSKPIASGSGCPGGGDVKVTTSEHRDGFSVFVTLPGVYAQTSRDELSVYRSCNLAIPVQVPAGFQVAFSNVKLHGWFDVPASGEGSLKREYFFTGGRGAPATLDLDGAGWLDHEDKISDANLQWSRCGADTIARVNTSLTAKAPEGREARRGDDAIVALDTFGESPTFELRFKHRTCN